MIRFRLIFGFALWGIVLIFLATAPFFFSKNPWVKSIQGVGEYVSAKRQTVTIHFPVPLYVKRGDPIFFQTENGLIRVGQIIHDEYDDDRLARLSQTRAVFFGGAPPVTNDCFLTMHETPLTFEWALNRLFPEERKKEIAALLVQSFEEHRDEIIAGFEPILLETFREARIVLQEDLRNEFAMNRERLVKIANRYQEGFVEKRLIPLIKDEIWPIVESETRPVLDEVGSEIWKRASLWRFGWRLAYDKFPLTNSNLAQKEWNRFVKDEALPVVEDYSDEFYAVARKIMRQIGENDEVKSAVKDGIQQVMQDEELKALVKETVWNLFLKNERLNEVLRKNLTSQQTVDLMRETSEKFEDHIRAIGDEIFGTFDRGITTEFAGVLRKEILRRDSRWLILRQGTLTAENVDRLGLAKQITCEFSMDQTPRPEFVRSRD